MGAPTLGAPLVVGEVLWAGAAGAACLTVALTCVVVPACFVVAVTCVVVPACLSSPLRAWWCRVLRGRRYVRGGSRVRGGLGGRVGGARGSACGARRTAFGGGRGGRLGRFFFELVGVVFGGGDGAVGLGDGLGQAFDAGCGPVVDLAGGGAARAGGRLGGAAGAEEEAEEPPVEPALEWWPKATNQVAAASTSTTNAIWYGREICCIATLFGSSRTKVERWWQPWTRPPAVGAPSERCGRPCRTAFAGAAGEPRQAC